MKKWIGPLLSLLLILILGISLVYGSFPFFKKTMPPETKSERYRMVPVQDQEKKEETDPHLIQVLKELQKALDEWLKKLNERIESEDVTRLEVRFLEILRNILEWVKEKVDAKIESAEKDPPKKKPKKGRFDDVYHRNLSFSKMG